jgi:hypothetical protein
MVKVFTRELESHLIEHWKLKSCGSLGSIIDLIGVPIPENEEGEMKAVVVVVLQDSSVLSAKNLIGHFLRQVNRGREDSEDIDQIHSKSLDLSKQDQDVTNTFTIRWTVISNRGDRRRPLVPLVFRTGV